jgi:RNA polymerase sigma-70 factor (ECF subfamily)
MNVFALLQKASDTPSAALSPSPSVDSVFRTHADFVWSSLQRFGVRSGDLDDALQEVFVVVHKKLASFRGDSQMTTWLYAICLRVASAHRRKSHVRHEHAHATEELDEGHSADLASPEDDLADHQRRRILEQLLDELTVEKRALMVMFEIDELSCEEIAEMLGVPVGTVYSRLHSARRAFQKCVTRFQARAKGAPP